MTQVKNIALFSHILQWKKSDVNYVSSRFSWAPYIYDLGGVIAPFSATDSKLELQGFYPACIQHVNSLT
jgi:hypothetical protein